jgi:hypothetical protein
MSSSTRAPITQNRDRYGKYDESRFVSPRNLPKAEVRGHLWSGRVFSGPPPIPTGGKDPRAAQVSAGLAAPLGTT